MADEKDDELTPEQQAAEEDSAFASGFEASDQPEPQPEAEPSEKPEKPEESEEPEKPEGGEGGEKEELAITPEQIRAFLAKSEEVDNLKESLETGFRKVYGKIGELSTVMQQIQAARAKKLTIPESGLKNLSAEFPEMAKYLQDDLAEILGQVGTDNGPGLTPESVAEMLKPRFDETLSEVDKRVERRLLRRAHPDWEKVVQAATFEEWRKTLPPEKAEELFDSFDADFLADMLTQHKEWLAAKSAEAKRKQERLERAIVPMSRHGKPKQGEAIMDEETAFLAAYNQNRG